MHNNAFDNTNREAEIQAALQSLFRQKRPNITATVRHFNVPMRTLGQRYHGRNSRFQRRPTLGRLNNAEEDSIVDYCSRIEEFAPRMRYRDLTHLANRILAERYQNEGNDNSPPRVSQMWPTRFLKRHPEIAIQKQHSIDLVRATQSPTVVSNWFHTYEKLIRTLGILQEDIWNFDETGFQIGVGRSQKVVVSTSNKRKRSISRLSRLSLQEAAQYLHSLLLRRRTVLQNGTRKATFFKAR